QVTSSASSRRMTRQAAKRKMAFLKGPFILVIGLWFSAFWAVQISAKQPNFLVVLADDLGYGDLGCYGRKDAHTPNLDRFAKEGLRFTHCYAANANCSPSRTGLMTGRTPTRVGVSNWIPMLSPMHVSDKEITIATLLKQNGYDTAHIGKWHLNGRFNLPGQPQPNDHGFSHWFSTQNNALPNHKNPYNFVRNGIPTGPIKGFSAQIVTDEAIRWLNSQRDKKKPFFLFVCYHEPHEPIATDPKFAKLHPSGDPSHSAYWGNITQLDDGFGRLMAEVDRLKLNENLFTFFTSDNGPARTGFHPHGETGSLREKKGWLYEGGIRVPGILRWPRKTRPGSSSDIPISGVDLLPTLCEIAGIEKPADRAIDGTSFLPLLSGKPIRRKTPLYWHFYAASGKPKVAMRIGDWKILAHLDAPEISKRVDLTAQDQKTLKTAKLGKLELYNLRADPGETLDLATSETERLKKMGQRLQEIYSSVQKDCPTWPDWEWARYEHERIQWPPYRGKRKVEPRIPKIPPPKNFK
ncbi:uncharacterized protein METZ01_LOCUS211573, partial [marine metagenome]